MSKGIHLLTWIVIVMISTAMSCKTPKASGGDDSSVIGTKATVVDYTGLDGCGKMLMLDDNRLLLPTNDEGVVTNLHYGQRVAITFTEQEAMVSICMAENFSAKIETIDLIENTDFAWLDKTVAKSNPYSIYRCNDDDATFIYIQTGKMATAYTLDGQEICNTPGKAMSDCVRRFNASEKCRIKGMP